MTRKKLPATDKLIFIEEAGGMTAKRKGMQS
jgi:hypothetical protein